MNHQCDVECVQGRRRQPTQIPGLSALAAAALLLVTAIAAVVAPTPVSAAVTVTAVPYGSAWSYLDDGSDQGQAWRDPEFDDGAWSMGVGQFGYGDGDEATVVSYGPNRWRKHATTYFRKTVNLNGVAGISAAEARVRFDDGAVVYVNGVEVVRVGMPATFDYATYTGAYREGTRRFAIDPALLVEGQNLIAVEMHQGHRASSDMSFDLTMTTTGSAVPVATTTVPATTTTTVAPRTTTTVLPTTTVAQTTTTVPTTTTTTTVPAPSVPGWVVGEHPAIDLDAISLIPRTGHHGVLGSNPNDATNQRVKVWDMQQVGAHMYVGGEFQQVQLGDRGALVNQAFLARFTIVNGHYDPTFTPVLDGNVHALELTADGKLLIGGQFTSVNGVANTEGLAAIDPITAAVDTTFRASVMRPWSSNRPVVREIEISGDDLYVVGNFSHVYDRQTRVRTRVYKAARFDVITGAHDAAWLPEVVSSSVWGVAADTDRDRVYLTGRFASVAGVPGTARRAIVDSITGAVVPNTLPASASWQTYDVEYVAGRIFMANNRDNRVSVYDADTFAVVAEMSRSDGDFQFVEKIGEHVFAGCHCWEDPDYPFIRAFDALTGQVVDKRWDISGNIEGIWTATTDSTGCLWLGGDVRDGGFTVGKVWARGFARFCQ